MPTNACNRSGASQRAKLARDQRRRLGDPCAPGDQAFSGAEGENLGACAGHLPHDASGCVVLMIVCVPGPLVRRPGLPSLSEVRAMRSVNERPSASIGAIAEAKRKGVLCAARNGERLIDPLPDGRP